MNKILLFFFFKKTINIETLKKPKQLAFINIVHTKNWIPEFWQIYLQQNMTLKYIGSLSNPQNKLFEF